MPAEANAEEMDAQEGPRPMPLWGPASLNFLIILAFTTGLILWDLETKNRPFPFGPIVRSGPFISLTLLQGAIVFGFLVALVASGRAKFGSYVDAIWVSLAGLSLLKTLPAPKGQNAQQLWGFADWLFGKFYRALRARILSLSAQFTSSLIQRYTITGGAAQLLTDTSNFINFNQNNAAAAQAETQRVTNQFNTQANESQKIAFLANYVAPRTTCSEWRQINGGSC